MGKSSYATFVEIKRTQAALRGSTESARCLTEKSDELIRRHRDEMERGD